MSSYGKLSYSSSGQKGVRSYSEHPPWPPPEKPQV